MTEIRDRGVRTDLRDLQRANQGADADVRDLIRDIKKDHTRAAELARVDVRALAPETQRSLGQMLAQELRGQLPAALAQAVAQATVGPELLQNLSQRFASAYSTEARQLPLASSADAARTQAADPSTPQQALRWTQFVQKAQHVPGSQLHGRAGSAAPKGELATLNELIRQRGKGGASLRAPKLVERTLADLSPGTRAMLMKATFGEKVAGQLGALGIKDPLSLVQAGAMPHDRAALSETLGVGRGKLLGMLMRAELLKIGPGKNGELGVTPSLLKPLHAAGVGMLGTMAALRTLEQHELSFIHGLLRKAAGGFLKAVKGGRPPVKRDLIHWARTAGRKPSDLLLNDHEARHGPLSKGDAQELIYAWYVENLFWETLARRQQMLEEQRLRDEERRERQRGEGDGEGEGAEGEGRDDDERAADDPLADLELDRERDDRLICFWITDFNANPALPEAMRRMYVCIDPDTGGIIPQQMEAELLPAQ